MGQVEPGRRLTEVETVEVETKVELKSMGYVEGLEDHGDAAVEHE